MAVNATVEQLALVLQASGVERATTLAAELGIGQSTLSRAFAALGPRCLLSQRRLG